MIIYLIKYDYSYVQILMVSLIIEGGPAQDAKGENKNVKDHMIPLELDKTVEQLKKHIKDEKAVCSDVSHCTDKAFTKVKQGGITNK